MEGKEDVEGEVKIKEVRENKRSGERQRDRGRRKITETDKTRGGQNR